MKQFFSLMMGLSLLFSSIGCAKLKELDVEFDIKNKSFSVEHPDVPAGDKTIIKTVANALDDKFFTDNPAIKKEKISKLEVISLEVKLADAATYTLADIESAEVFAGTKSLGKLPAGATGKTVVFTNPLTKDIKDIFLATPTPTNIECKFVGKFKKDIKASTITCVYALKGAYAPL